MSDGDQISISISGGKQTQVAGKIENRDSHIGDIINGGELTAAKFFEAIEAEIKTLPQVQQEEIKQAVEPLKEMAVQPVEVAAKPAGSSGGSSVSKYLDKLRPHASLIARCLAVFSESILTKLADTDPSGVISGVLAVTKEVRAAVK